jgi:hypothetical protein
VEGKENDRLDVSILRSIAGPIDLPDTVPELRIVDSVIDGEDNAAISAPGSQVRIETSTIDGTSETRSLEASESLFSGVVIVERRQVGCVRFSHVPVGSRTPRRYRCQPDLALKDIKDPVERASIQTRLTPLFTSTNYGDPAYYQMRPTCAREICTGAEDGSEMGVFHYLRQSQREANLRAALDEYLRFGIEAGIFYVV